MSDPASLVMVCKHAFYLDDARIGGFCLARSRAWCQCSYFGNDVSPTGTPLLAIRGKAWEFGKRTLGHRQPYRHSVGVHRQVQLAVQPPFVRAMDIRPGRRRCGDGPSWRLSSATRNQGHQSPLQQSGPHAPVPPRRRRWVSSSLHSPGANRAKERRCAVSRSR